MSVTDLSIVPQPDYPELVRQAAERLREARVLFAQTFVLTHASWKGPKPITDRLAHEMTVNATKDEITTLQAELDIVTWLMKCRQTQPYQ